MTPLVTYCPALADACAAYRMFYPHLHVPMSRYIGHRDRFPWELIVDSDIAVVQRQNSAKNFRAMEMMKRTGLKIVYDLDDDLWTMPAQHPTKKVFEATRQGMESCMNLADVITVSTPYLATAARTQYPQSKKEIRMVRNAIDTDLFVDRSDRESQGDVVRIAWAGSNTHLYDVGEVWEVLPEILEQNSQVQMEFIGLPPPKGLQKHERVLERWWVPVAQYPARIGSYGWDVVLAPLSNHRFNRSKSCIRQLESACVGAVCLASPSQEYVYFTSFDPELAWTLCSGASEWRKKIRTLVNEPERRAFLLERAWKVVREHFTISQTIGEWLDVFASVC